MARFHSEIEPLVRLIEEMPRNRVLEEGTSAALAFTGFGSFKIKHIDPLAGYSGACSYVSGKQRVSWFAWRLYSCAKRLSA